MQINSLNNSYVQQGDFKKSSQPSFKSVYPVRFLENGEQITNGKSIRRAVKDFYSFLFNPPKTKRDLALKANFLEHDRSFANSYRTQPRSSSIRSSSYEGDLYFFTGDHTKMLESAGKNLGKAKHDKKVLETFAQEESTETFYNALKQGDAGVDSAKKIYHNALKDLIFRTKHAVLKNAKGDELVLNVAVKPNGNKFDIDKITFVSANASSDLTPAPVLTPKPASAVVEPFLPQVSPAKKSVENYKSEQLDLFKD